MLDEKLVERVTRFVDVQLAERRKQIPMEVNRVKREANAHGTLHSSNTVLRIQEICAREIEIRAVLAWQGFVRVHRALGGDLVDSDLKEFITRYVVDAYTELTGVLSQNLMNLMTVQQLSLDDIRDHVIRKHEVEIDMYLDSMNKGSQVEGAQRGATHYNFYGNVGAVQTGANASANVVQNLEAGDKDALLRALELARESLAAAQEIADNRKQELIRIVDEVRGELQSDAPNNTKLQTLFMMIGTTIQSIASAGPAYQALKGALIPLGIMLP